MWSVISTLVIACATHAPAQPSVALSVRVTDWSWAALPGIEVEVAEVENCLEAGKTGGSKQSSTTNRDGLAEFRVSEKKSYRLVTSTDGGFEAQTQCVHIGNGSEPRHVQLRVRPDPGSRVTLAVPAVPDKRRDETNLAAAIERFHAGAVVVRPADVDARSCGPIGESPGMVATDLNGDGRQDFGVLLMLKYTGKETPWQGKVLREAQFAFVMFVRHGGGGLEARVVRRYTEYQPSSVVIELEAAGIVVTGRRARMSA